ncbi:patatin-like phospholipase family protein [Aquabacterium sp. J223]|uniref:patatin-like phospholipase family protein n=1 Tax=Aquabacterium sp. J223 TaxID=2898431 RepID=UPI0021ADDDC7|nr:patatin-like phospholipase family protein [Aquabacterium sp. J223]UUX97484.1 patatin-like phospholipase family protein [Aquabacterium sp. J223]
MSRRTAAAGLLVLAAGCTTAPNPPPVVAVPPPVPPVAPPTRPPRFGLALGGGAARGFAHIGVLQVLEENGLRPALLAGTSAGSLVAALYASGHSAAELGRLAESLDEGVFADWAYPGRGLIRGEALARFVREHTGGRTIEQLPLPLGIVATDLDSGEGVLFRRGDTGLAVRASSAVPAVFQPVRIAGREYVDGGLASPVPVRHARQMGAEVVLAVDISQPPEGAATGDAVRLLLQTFAIMARSINRFELQEADFVLRPRLPGVAGTDFTARRRALAAGRDAAQSVLPALRQRLATGVPDRAAPPAP